MTVLPSELGHLLDNAHTVGADQCPLCCNGELCSKGDLVMYWLEKSGDIVQSQEWRWTRVVIVDATEAPEF